MLKMGAILAKSSAEKKTMLTDYDNVAISHIKEIAAAIENYMHK